MAATNDPPSPETRDGGAAGGEEPAPRQFKIWRAEVPELPLPLSESASPVRLALLVWVVFGLFVVFLGWCAARRLGSAVEGRMSGSEPAAFQILSAQSRGAPEASRVPLGTLFEESSSGMRSMRKITKDFLRRIRQRKQDKDRVPRQKGTVDRWKDIAEELSKDLESAFPDPVDTFEDELVHQLGLIRHPTCSLYRWRQVRVRYLNASEDEVVEVALHEA